MTNKAKTVFYNLARRKRYFDVEDSGATELARCLSTFDLIALGVGSTLGAGVYVLTGAVAHQVTGPSIILSFLVAAVASVMAGLCYAEFGSRVPKAGSAYVYSYVTVGECWAFIIGWNLILEYVIGTSSVARAWSENVDALLDGRLRNFSMTHLSINTPGLAEYPDFFAFIIILILTGVLCFGVKESALFTKIFTGINVAIILFVIIGGSIVADTKNWRLTPADITNFSLTQCLKARNLTYDGTQTLASLNCSTTNGMGKGGFLPFGFSGMIKGAATCFFGFVGFDVIATTGEEVKNPQRSIPISIVVSLGIVFVAYVGISSVLTLMVPYYILDIGAPLPRAFASVGWDWAVHPLAIGGTCALSSSLMGGLFPMPRVVYAMAQDGLIFKFLASVSKRFKTPIAATLLAGLLSAIMVLLFDLKDLVDMMSIGTLLAYTLVAACILILRYQPESRNPNSSIVIHSELATDKSNSEASGFSCHRILHPFTHPTQKSGQLVYICVLMIGTLNFAMCSILTNFHDFTAPLITVLIVLACLNVALSCVILRQPQSQTKVSFMVPFVPILPLLSVFCNIYLMCELSAGTWIRFSVWMVIGAITYFGYGYKHSAENVNRDKRGTKLRTYNVEEEY